MAAVMLLRSSLVRAVRPIINRRLISTSKKNSDTATIASEAKIAVNKNWVSYGFERKSQTEDVRSMHATFFISVSVCLILGGFVLTYVPDYNLRDWSQREAFLELRRREKLGLPLVDPNIVDPSKMTLPSDEELGDTEIII